MLKFVADRYRLLLEVCSTPKFKKILAEIFFFQGEVASFEQFFDRPLKS